MLAEQLSSSSVPDDLVYFVDGDHHLVVNPEVGTWQLLDSGELDVLRRLVSDLPFPVADRREIERVLAKLVLNSMVYLPGRRPDLRQMDAPLKVAYYAVTHGCNLTCPYCYASADRRLPDELSTAEALDVIDQIAAMGAETVVFTGGEALMRKDIFELAARVRERGMTANIITNATLIRTPATARRMAEAFSIVSVSMDGGTAETHEVTRGRGTFAKTTAALRMLNDAGVRPYINHVVTHDNVDRISQLRDLLAGFDIAGLRAMHHSPIGRGADDESGGFGWPDFLKLHASTWSDPRAEDLMPDGPVNRKGAYTHINCGMGGNEIAIDPCGNVSPCKLLTDDVHLAGNLRQSSLRELFAGPLLADLRSSAVFAGDNLKGCRSCYVRGACGGGCRAFHLAHSGDLKRNSRSLCRILRHQVITSMWVAAGVRRETVVDRGDGPFRPHLVATGALHPGYDEGQAGPDDPPTDSPDARGRELPLSVVGGVQ